MEIGNITPIKKHTICEVTINDTSSLKVYLPDIQKVRGKRITGFESYKVGQVPVSPTAKALAADDVFNQSFLTLVNCDSNETVEKIPVTTLNAQNNDGKTKFFEARNLDFQKCYIDFPNGTNLVANTVLLFSVYYEDMPKVCSNTKGIELKRK